MNIHWDARNTHTVACSFRNVVLERRMIERKMETLVVKMEEKVVKNFNTTENGDK